MLILQLQIGRQHTDIHGWPR